MSQDPYHFAVIARALTVIDQSGPGLSLDDLAAKMNMSPAHFQRLFSQWVGISPKRYQQYLALDHAKHLLADRFTVLDTALATGLSGGGRLHDLFVKWEAMSPGDYAKAGEGLTIQWSWFDSPFGPAVVMGTERGICGMGFAADMGDAAALADLTSRWPRATFRADDTPLRPWVQAAFGAGNAPLYLIGAPFQIKVWEALMRIPSGHVTTHRPAQSRARHRHRCRAQSDQLSDPLPPRLAQIRRIGWLSLGPARQTRHPRLGSRAAGRRARGGLTLRHARKTASK